MTEPRLGATLIDLSRRGASAVVARGRLSSAGLNAALLRRLAGEPGGDGSLLAEPIIEIARNWATTDRTFGELAGDLLHPRLVQALDRETAERMPRDRKPYAHQIEAWEALLREDRSC